jgi:hypothetical protein
LLPEDRCSAIEHQANELRSYADLRDLLVEVSVAAGECKPFSAIPDLGPQLFALRDVPSMRSEGHLMRNCLADHVADAAAGLRVYYRWVGSSERASVSLWRTADGFVLDELAGFENTALSSSTERAIRVALVKALGPEVTNQERASAMTPVPLAKPGFERLVRLGSGLSPRALEKVSDILSLALSLPPHELGSRVTLSAGGPYVTAVANRPPGAFLVAVASHHVRPLVETYLDPKRAHLLEDAGFLWPRPGMSFLCTIPVGKERSCERLAGALLGLLRGVFGLASGNKFKIRLGRS